MAFAPTSISPLRVLIAGGGTGGHLFPGIALAEEVRARGGEVLFVGTPRGLEATVLPEEGWPLELIEVRGIKGRGLTGLLGGLLRLPRAFGQSMRILRAFRPDVVVGVGGYASGPVVATAALLRLPTAILEQNSIPGLTNRLLARVVDRVFCMFEDRFGRFPAHKVVVSGNPIRGSIARRMQAAREIDPDHPPRVLVFGGSQGARAINERMPDVFAALRHRFPRLQVRHQTGAADETSVRSAYAERGLQAPTVRVQPFIRDMAEAYGWADVVICRAGATSLAELAVAGRPAVLIPFPHATDDHQRWNAQSLVDRGAAQMVLQPEADVDRLTAVLQELLGDPDRLQAMQGAMIAAGRPEARANIHGALEQLAGRTPSSPQS